MRRRPYVVLGIWTLLIAVPLVWLRGRMAEPVIPGCFEYCTLAQDLAAFGFVILGVVWLFGTLVVARQWRDKDPTVAAVSAIAAGLLLAVVFAGVFQAITPSVITQEDVLLAWVLAIGLELPAVWRLTTRVPPSTPLRVVAGALGIVAVAAALAIVLFGRRFVFDTGPSIVVVAWFGFALGLILVAIAAWRDGAASAMVAAPLVVASLPAMLVPVAMIAPGPYATATAASLPLTAIAWLWLAAAWLRGIDPPRVRESDRAVTDVLP